jgi:hypothetical protein
MAEISQNTDPMGSSLAAGHVDERARRRHVRIVITWIRDKKR